MNIDERHEVFFIIKKKSPEKELWSLKFIFIVHKDSPSCEINIHLYIRIFNTGPIPLCIGLFHHVHRNESTFRHSKEGIGKYEYISRSLTISYSFDMDKSSLVHPQHTHFHACQRVLPYFGRRLDTFFFPSN